MIIALLFALLASLAVGQFLLFGGFAEAYRDISQLREFGGMLNRTAPVDLGQVADALASDAGLDPRLDHAASATVVCLNDGCGTCWAIVASLNGTIPDGIWLVAVAGTPEEAFMWLGTGGIHRDSTPADRVMAMTPDEVERRLGTSVTPLVIDIERGRLVRARTISSIRQFSELASSALTRTSAVTKGVAP